MPDLSDISFIFYPRELNELHLRLKAKNREQMIQSANLKLLCLLTMLFGAGSCFAQHEITYQPDSIYKVNRVKSRVIMYNYSRYNTKMIDFFDQSGLLIDHLEFDTSGLHLLWRHSRNYNANKLFIKDVFYNYRHYDSVRKIFIRSNEADTQVSKVEYDSAKHIMHQTSSTKWGIKTYEATINYDSMEIKEKWFYEDGAFETKTRWWEKYGTDRKVINIIQLPNGSLKSEEVFYKNYFDKQGRVTRSKVKKTGSLHDKKNEFYFKEIDYQYSKVGLLIKKNYSEASDNSDWISTQIFDYSYW